MKLYPKIDIYTRVERLDGRSVMAYRCSTNWSATCREAKARYIEANPHFKPDEVKASRSKKS